MRSGSTSRATQTLGALLFLAACARPAPPLPAMDTVSTTRLPSLTEGQRLSRCTRLADETATLRAEILEIEQVIQGRRTREQVTAYLAAVLYPPLLTSMGRKKAQMHALDERQREIDNRLVERQARHCPSVDRS